jgi:nucleoside 2-deoxyribosyltransferase
MVTSPFRCYLAGPDVFLTDALSITAAKRDLCRTYGFVGVSPVDNEVEVSHLQKRAAGLAISAANEKMIRSCDFLVANLTPFRGPSADVGTVYELGFARGLNLPVFGYTNLADSYLDRVLVLFRDQLVRRQRGLEDSYGMVVEDFDLSDNLMIDGAVQASGSTIVVSDAPVDRRFTDLRGFEECLRLAMNYFGSPRS